MLLSKTTYRQVVKKLDTFKKQDDEDKKENPNRIPAGWKIPIIMMIESTIRQNKERCPKGIGEQVVDYFIKQGILVEYYGDVTFPGRVIPSREQIIDEANKIIDRLG